MGQRLGVDRLAKYAKASGLGARTGIELDHEASGLVPTAAWKKRRTGVKWQRGESLSIAIGQGFNLDAPQNDAHINKGQLKHVVLRLPKGGVKGSFAGRGFETAADLLKAIRQRCKQIGAKLEVEKGTGEMAYLDRYRLRL